MARFASRKREFRVFLRHIASGGRWADFSPNGEYSTDNKEDIADLTSKPNYKRDYWVVTPITKAKYGCPEPGCDYVSDKPKTIIGHVFGKHRKHIKLKDVPIIKD